VATSPLVYPGRPEEDVFSMQAVEPDWSDIELSYWRGRLLTTLDRRAVEHTFAVMTAHAEPAPFVYDPVTRCMRNLRSTG